MNDETLAERMRALADEWDRQAGAIVDVLGPEARTLQRRAADLRALLDIPAPSPVGDVEALAAVLHQAFHQAWNPSISLDLYPDSPIWQEQARAVAGFAAAQRAEALREAADEADSVGHHWSGAPAHAFFALAGDLRDRADREARP